MLHALIMAGGAGTRFWPASRRDRPKQLLQLAGQQTMIQSTVARLDGLVSSDQLMILTNQRLVEPMRQQLPELPASGILGEPCKRDTAPCVGLAAAWMMKHDPDATMVVTPADHVIGPVDAFQAAIRRAEALVDQNPQRLVTFGIQPTYAAETFGYVERGEVLDADASQTDPPTSFQVVQFHEKPKRAVAEQYLASGSFYWNSGIFVWKANTIMEALREFEPQMATHLGQIADAIGTDGFDRVLQSEFEAIDGKSIDFAVLERHADVAVIQAPFQWDDVGSWKSLTRLNEPDAEGNTILGRHLGVRTEGCVVRTDDQHLVVTLGVKDLIVVHTDDATLVAHQDDEESIRKLVDMLQERGWDGYL